MEICYVQRLIMISPVGFGSTITVGDLDYLCSSPDETHVVVWSMQQPEAVDRLLTDGILSGDPHFAFAPDVAGKIRPGIKAAYAWMQQQMTRRLKGYQQELPVWTLLSRPSHTTRKSDKLLRLEIPKSRMLISFYQAWCDLRPTFAVLEQSEGWPEDWSLSARPYVATDADDARRHIYLKDANGAQRTQWDENECRLSWERIFDLTLARSENFLWSDLVLQGTVPAIYRADVRDILSIATTPPWG